MAIHGVNISDPSHTFSPAEWHKLGPEGRKFVNSECDIANSGRGHGGGKKVQFHNINAVEARNSHDNGDNEQQMSNDGNHASANLGGNNGCGFGKGVYGKKQCS